MLDFPLRNVEGVTAEQSVDLFLQLHQIARVKGVPEALSREKHQSLVEALISALVATDLRSELHKATALEGLLLVDRLVDVNYPGVVLSHLDSFFIKFLFFRGQNLRFSEISLLCLLLEHVLLILQPE